ncbi:hypothetical protein BD626DRAFT_466992 [Schizophyllum amplum]|uniref:MULE transposase domain-containing protein n=1 Tax=Schizophyllum amplum TaxID=97359 RepID=A0A550BTR8_9AGAR|nr:hypothetical protein BD626DRAFT_466992 [Auriculariopsis ampla]
MDFLDGRENVFRVWARVQEESVEGKALRDRADRLAESIGECLKYRFIYTSKYVSKEEPWTRFVYHCAQLRSRQRASCKSDSKKQCDKGSMITFDCDGWLHIVVWEDAEPASISIKHDNDHIPYWRIDVPKNVQDYVRAHPEMRPNQLYSAINEKFGIQQFSRKSIYNLWAEREQQKWRLDPDPVVSAQKLIDAAVAVRWGNGDSTYSVQSVPLPHNDGVDALAFSMPEILRKWGGKIREIALDSAWNTNGLGYEIYAILGEVCGSGCPLAYLFINISAPQAKGTKEDYVRAVLRHLREVWNIRASVTLSDKDWSEINASLKKRLPIKDRAPAFYDVESAMKEFSWIERDFVPVAQINSTVGVSFMLSCPSLYSHARFNLGNGGTRPAHDEEITDVKCYICGKISQSSATALAARHGTASACRRTSTCAIRTPATITKKADAALEWDQAVDDLRISAGPRARGRW